MKHLSKNIAILILLVFSLLNFTECKKKATLPVVTTLGATDITQTTASSGGNVTDDGSADVTSRGVCWNTAENPTISNSKSSDGKGTGSFTSSLMQLTPGTKYYIRAYATNEAGTGYGNQLSFTTGQISLATLTTVSVTSIEGTTAVSGGNITSDGGGQITARGVCWGTDEDPTTSNEKTIDGSGTGIFSSNITGLIANTAYHVRAYAINSAGTAYGNDLTFTTLGGMPSAATYSASDISSTSVTLNGYAVANYSLTTVTFEYGTTASYGQTVEATPGTVTDQEGVSAIVSGLDVGTEYHFRVKAVNDFGTFYGNDLTFTTLGGMPSAATYSASDISSTSVTLNGYAVANYSLTTVTFEYGTTASYGQTVEATPGTVTDQEGVSASVSGLDVGTEYHFRVKAVNDFGTFYGNDLTFTTLGGMPSAATYSASDVSSTSVTLNGYAVANYSLTTVTFEYGTTASYGQTVEATPGTVTDQEGVSASVSGLDVGTEYHFRVKAVNDFGTAYGNDQLFTTSGSR